MKHPKLFKIFVLAAAGTALVLGSGCNSTKAAATYQRPAPPVTARSEPIFAGEGEQLVGYQTADGQIIRTGDVGAQIAQMAMNLPTEPWFSAILPDLFGPNPEEVRNGLIMYGAKLDAWAKRAVRVEPTITEIEFPDGTAFKQTSGGFYFHPDPVPDMPKFMSGLQRLGIGGQEIITAMLSWFVFDFAKTSSNNQTSTANAGAAAATSAAEAGFAAGAEATATGVGLGAGL